jgi:hypothetical protein
MPIPVTFEGPLSFTEAQLAQYDRCPRRFFYTYVLQLGGRRSTTPFMDMHEVVSGLVVELSTRPPEGLTTTEINVTFEAAWAGHPVSEHGYAEDFRKIARSLIDYYVESRQGHVLEPAATLRLPVPGGEVVVTPDEVLVGSDGQRALRRVRTGHKRSKEEKGIAAAAFQLAASEAFPGCRVVLVFLGDGEPTPVALSPKVLANNRQVVADMLKAISGGQFLPEESSFTCPRCPAFFICGPIPAGPLRKKF